MRELKCLTVIIELNVIFHYPRSREGIGLALWLDVGPGS